MPDSRILITLHSLPFEGQERKYYGRINNAGTLSTRRIARRIADGRTDLRPETIEHVMNLALQEIADALACGRCVDLGIGSLRPTLSGTFDSPYQSFDPERHSIGLTFVPSDKMNRQLRQADITTSPATDATYITDIYDALTQTTNQTISASNPVRISGLRLRIVGSDPQVGLYFVHSNGLQYPAEHIATNTNRQLLVLAPSMPEGTCQIRIVTQGGSRGRLTRQLTDYTSDISLTVR